MTDWGPTRRSGLALFIAPELRVWRGQAPLVIVFWGYGVAASLGIVVLYAMAAQLGQILLQQALLILAALYTVWIVVGIWRCSPNAAPSWGTLARWLTVTWALNSGFVLAFLQLGLMVQYGRG